MWTRTRVVERLRIDVPILQGPFGGGYSTVDLAVAVSNAGGLGAFGAVNLTPDQIVQTVHEIARRTSRPFQVNLWVPISGQDDQLVDPGAFARARTRLAPYFAELGLPFPEPPTDYAIPFAAQAEALIGSGVPAISFVMGVPDAALIEAAKARGIVTLATATTVEEALAIEAAGIDVVVASGSDAGGHRGSFQRSVDESLCGTFSLVPQVVRAVRVPVVAAGGIADGHGIAAALALGAEGAQVGSAFLATPESGAPDVHKALLGTPAARRTRLTRGFTGRYARGVVNELMAVLDQHDEDILPYPAQSWLTTTIRRAAATRGRAERLALWAGQNAASARQMPAAELLHRLIAETDAVLASPALASRR